MMIVDDNHGSKCNYFLLGIRDRSTPGTTRVSMPGHGDNGTFEVSNRQASFSRPCKVRLISLLTSTMPVLLLLAGLQMRDSYLCKEKDHIIR